MITQPQPLSAECYTRDLLIHAADDANDLRNKTIDAAKKGFLEKVHQAFPNLGAYSFFEVINIFREIGMVVVVNETIGGRLVVSSGDISQDMWKVIEAVPPKQ